MHLTFLILTIFLSQSNGFLADGRPLFPPRDSSQSNGFLSDGKSLFSSPASNINNSLNLPMIQITGDQGGNGGAEAIPGENGKSNVQIQRIDNPPSMTMKQTNPDGKSPDLFMTNGNHSMAMMQTNPDDKSLDLSMANGNHSMTMTQTNPDDKSLDLSMANQNHSMTMTQTNPDDKSLDLSMANQNHSMTMKQTNPDGKSPDLFMVMNNNQSTINTPTQAPVPSNVNATNAPNTNKMMWYNNNANKPASLFMLPKMMLSTTAGNQSSVVTTAGNQTTIIVTGGNGADAKDGGKDGSLQVQVINGKVFTKTN